MALPADFDRCVEDYVARVDRASKQVDDFTIDLNSKIDAYRKTWHAVDRAHRAWVMGGSIGPEPERAQRLGDHCGGMRHPDDYEEEQRRLLAVMKLLLHDEEVRLDTALRIKERIL